MRKAFQYSILTATVVFAMGPADSLALEEKMTMSPMKMTGTCTMMGKTYDAKCDMEPIGKPKKMAMSMDAPMSMTGIMTMMGQKYKCTMKMTPSQKSK